MKRLERKVVINSNKVNPIIEMNIMIKTKNAPSLFDINRSENRKIKDNKTGKINLIRIDL